jgi:tetratricopeptide (TPR) repeat protein
MIMSSGGRCGGVGRWLLPIVLVGALGCVANNSPIQELQRQVQLQAEEIKHQQAQIAALQAQSHPQPALPPPACDHEILRLAQRHGDQQMAAGNFKNALGYFQDALSACPKNDKALLSAAQAASASGERALAIEYYRRAAKAADPAVATRARQALAAMNRS